MFYIEQKRTLLGPRQPLDADHQAVICEKLWKRDRLRWGWSEVSLNKISKNLLLYQAALPAVGLHPFVTEEAYNWLYWSHPGCNKSSTYHHFEGELVFRLSISLKKPPFFPNAQRLFWGTYFYPRPIWIAIKLAETHFAPPKSAYWSSCSFNNSQ